MKLETEDSFPRLPPVGDLETPQPSKKRTRTTSTRASERTQSPKKRKRGFAPPEQYAHLNYLQDILKEDLDSKHLPSARHLNP